jgi:radical SAM superfamily enzyme YgiQ (UPF0313 family)
MKIMLLSLPGMNQADENLFPLGIGYLAGSLKPDNEVEGYHFNDMNAAKTEIPLRFERFKPDLVGLTCSSFNRGFVRDTLRQIRSLDPNVTLVVGGVHASFCHDQMLEQYGADVVVIGEGERTLPELCAAIERKTPLRAVNGVANKDGGSIALAPPRDHYRNLDDLPMPDYEYARPFIEKSNMGFLISSRGCPVRCTFCSTSSYWGQKVRMCSPSRVVDEMEMLVSRFNVKKIFFHDDTFNLGIPRVKEICREIVGRGVRVEWACSCRVVPASEEMIACMVEAGCRHICWGVESGSEKILKTINKKISLDQIRNAFELSNRFSEVMSTGAFSLVGNPGESEETIRDTVNFFNTLPITDPPSTAILHVLPGTMLYEDLKRKGKIKDEIWYRYDSVPIYTIEHSLLTLMRWAKRVSLSGNRIPFDPKKHFWHVRPEPSRTANEDEGGMSQVGKTARRMVKAATKPHHYLQAGRLHY